MDGRSRTALAIGAVAFGAGAVGALAIGALAVGALAIGSLVVRRGHVHEFRIDDATIGTLRVDRLVVSERRLPSME